MQTVSASVIREALARGMGWDPDELDDREEAMIREAVSDALQEIWERWWWEALMQAVPIALAGEFAYNWMEGLYYETGHPVYFPQTDSYYVALWPAGPSALMPGESYATYGFNNGLPDWDVPVTTITENLYGWHKYNACQGEPTLWTPDLNPSLGDLCRFDGHVFQWIVNQGGLPNNQPDPAQVWVSVAAPISNPGWMLVPKWQPTCPFDAQDPNDSSPPNYISRLAGPAGGILSVSQRDPRATANAGMFHTREADDASGRVVIGLNVGRPWIYARRPTPVLTGNAYDATAAYDATPAQDLVFDS